MDISYLCSTTDRSYISWIYTVILIEQFRLRNRQFLGRYIENQASTDNETKFVSEWGIKDSYSAETERVEETCGESEREKERDRKERESEK